MKYGVREICDVVLKKKASGFFGKLYIDRNMPVIYFDTLKTSSLEGTSSTVYAQGGKGNPRLVAWDGDRTVTFTMEDALISPESFSILSGAGFMDATEDEKIYVHTTEQVELKKKAAGGDALEGGSDTFTFNLSKMPSGKGEMYIMILKEDGSIDTELLPILVDESLLDPEVLAEAVDKEREVVTLDLNDIIDTWSKNYAKTPAKGQSATKDTIAEDHGRHKYSVDDMAAEMLENLEEGRVVLVDYYVEASAGVKQIEITAGDFGGSYYLEASTLWRDQATGEDYPAEFVIPNCRIQSNFTFTMASTGDPSTFTFTMDAFPDYTKFDKTKKVIAAIQVVEDKNGFGQIISEE